MQKPNWGRALIEPKAVAMALLPSEMIESISPIPG
jgi:hypothetical protein